MPHLEDTYMVWKSVSTVVGVKNLWIGRNGYNYKTYCYKFSVYIWSIYLFFHKCQTKGFFSYNIIIKIKITITKCFFFSSLFLYFFFFRSQVVREACVTLAFMSQHLGNRFEHTADSVVPVLMNLIHNSAKVCSYILFCFN